jgi:mono/diheme cytochrome c family protein
LNHAVSGASESKFREVCFLLGAIAWATWQGSTSTPLIDANDARQPAKGRRVYAQYCASCHGANLEGQPAWRVRRADGRLPAPPHDASGHTWHHPDEVLIEIVSNGLQAGRYAPPGYSSDMPGVANILTEEDVRASLAYIKSTWPEAQRAHQSRVTLSAK